MMKNTCQHLTFQSHVIVNRLQTSGTFAADITIRCTECDTPFKFIGLPGGLAPDRPMCSVDGTEARMPIEPAIRILEVRGII